MDQLKFSIFLSFLTFLLLFQGCAKHKCPETQLYTMVLAAGVSGKDTRVDNYQPNTAFNDAESLMAAAWTINGNSTMFRSFIDFDYSSIPPGAEIQKATLQLFADTLNQGPMGHGHSTLSGENSFYVKHVTSSWNEATLTWNTQPSADDINEVLAPASSSPEENYSLDVTAMVKDQVRHPNNYFGFLLILANENYYRGVSFCSGSYPDPSRHPQLVVEYLL